MLVWSPGRLIVRQSSIHGPEHSSSRAQFLVGCCHVHDTTGTKMREFVSQYLEGFRIDVNSNMQIDKSFGICGNILT